MSSDSILSRDQILAAEDLPLELVDVPEWGGKVPVQGLTASGRDAFEKSIVRVDGQTIHADAENVRAKMAVQCCVHETTRERLFTDADIEALGRKSAQAMDRVFAVAARLSGMGNLVKELKKN